MREAAKKIRSFFSGPARPPPPSNLQTIVFLVARPLHPHPSLSGQATLKDRKFFLRLPLPLQSPAQAIENILC